MVLEVVLNRGRRTMSWIAAVEVVLVGLGGDVGLRL